MFEQIKFVNTMFCGVCKFFVSDPGSCSLAKARCIEDGFREILYTKDKSAYYIDLLQDFYRE